MENRQKVGFIGSAILLLGVFAPVISVPFVGDLNYVQAYKVNATAVLVLAVVSFVLAYLRKYKRLIITGTISLGLVLANFFHLLMEKSSTTSHTELGKALEKVFKQSIQIEWGWLVLITGSLMIIAAAVVKKQVLQNLISSGSVSSELTTKKSTDESNQQR